MSKNISLAGCFPPIPTPFDDKGRVDHEQLALNLEKWQKTSLTGFAVLGSNGEAVMLRTEEKLEIWKTAGQAIDSDHLFIAGTGCESTIETLELTKKAASLGADAAMVVTPHYYKSRMDYDALVNHYTKVADGSPIPIVLYSVPAFTDVDLGVEIIVTLSRHPNIIGLKESSGNVVKIGQVVAEADNSFQVLAGSGSFLLPALTVGAKGCVAALAAIAPHPLAELMEKFHKGEMETAREIQLCLIPPNGAVTARFGIPGLKAALDLIGMYGGPVRSPLRGITREQKEELKGILASAGIL